LTWTTSLYVSGLLSSLTIFVGTLFFLQFQPAASTPLTPASFGKPCLDASYDYIVIGGGTAGLAVAARLAENPILRIAVVEAGDFYEIDYGNRTTVPGYAGIGVGTGLNDTPPAVDWGFVTIPQAVNIAKMPITQTSVRDLTDLPDRVQTIGLCAMLEVKRWEAVLQETFSYTIGTFSLLG